MRFFLIILAYWILFCPPVWSGDPKQIELMDGSVITGEVLSLSKGIFTIHSDSVGTIRINSSQIREIRTPIDRKAAPSVAGEPSVLRNNPGMESQIRALQQAAASDPELLKQILSLQNDPDFQAALQDPGVLSAVQSGDINALLNHPKIQKLTGNPHVSEIQKRLP